jgi:parallel beta-helix repeat protein
MLIALLLAGCGGSSGGGSVFTGTNGNNNNNNFGNGQVTFNFVTAQAPLAVPAGTTELRFRFFDQPDATGNIVQENLEPFAPSITLTVTAQAQSYQITAFAGDIPVLQATGDLVVVVDGTTTVDFATANIQNVTITSLTVLPQTASILVDGTQQFTATANYSSGDVLPATGATWSASGGFASIDANTGLATGVAEGTSTITATLDGAQGTATLNVNDEIVSLTISPASPATTIVGTDIDFDVVAEDADGDVVNVDGLVVWSITGNIAQIDQTGNVTSQAPGSVSVTATLGNVSDSVDLTVEPRPLAEVILSPSDADAPLVATGGMLQFSATAFDTGGFPFSTSGAVFSVTQNATNALAAIDPDTGLLEAIDEGNDPSGEGSVVVTVTLGAFSDSTTVIIRDEPGDLLSIASTPNPIGDGMGSFVIGDTQAITVEGTFEEGLVRDLTNADGLTFMMLNSDETVASVNTLTGVVTANRQGTATVVVMVGNTFTENVPVTVDFNGGNQPPMLNVQGIAQNSDIARSASAILPFATTTFDDDQSSLAGGSITVEINPAATGTTIGYPGFPTDPAIGTVAGMPDTSLTITLGAGASPSAIQAFLRSVELYTEFSTYGPLSLTVTVNDGANSVMQTRDYSIVGGGQLNLTVNPGQAVSATNFHTIAAALTAVANVNGLGAEGSTITVVGGNFTSEGTFSINDDDQRGLTLNGANAGISGGVVPGTRNAESRITALEVDEIEVTVDGFQIETGDAATKTGVVVNTAYFTLSNCILVGGASMVDGGLGKFVGAPGLTVTNCGFSGWTLGITLANATEGTIRGCAFTQNLNGMVLTNSDGVSVLNCGFTDNQSAHLAVAMSNGQSFTASGCEFSNTVDPMMVTPPYVLAGNIDGAPTNATLLASGNFWGPGTEPPATPVAGVDYVQGANTTLIVTGNIADPFPNFGPPPAP